MVVSTLLSIVGFLLGVVSVFFSFMTDFEDVINDFFGGHADWISLIATTSLILVVILIPLYFILKKLTFEKLSLKLLIFSVFYFVGVVSSTYLIFSTFNF